MGSHVEAPSSGLRGDESGSVAIIFGVAIFVVFFCVGMAVDYGRALKVQTKMANAMDAAAVAGAKALKEQGLSSGAVAALARQFFDHNMEGVDAAFLTAFSVQVDAERNAVTIDASGNVATAFLRAVGYDHIPVAKSTAAIFDMKDIELSLSLDVTGSMCDPCTKIRALRSATEDLVDTLIPDGPSANKVRIAYAPFAAGVNAGDFAAAVSDSLSRNGCVYERRTGDALTDDAPVAGRLSVAGDPGVRPPAATPCPTESPVLALTSDKTVLKRAARNLETGGSTAGHLGTAWAWYLVSPKWASIWPAASRPVDYGSDKTIKAVVLMTDGIYNTLGGVNGGDRSRIATQSQNDARQLCRNMRNENVVVYSVGFQLDDANAVAMLQECASSVTHFFRAENADELRNAFREIGVQLSNLRLAR